MQLEYTAQKSKDSIEPLVLLKLDVLIFGMPNYLILLIFVFLSRYDAFIRIGHTMGLYIHFSLSSQKYFERNKETKKGSPEYFRAYNLRESPRRLEEVKIIDKKQMYPHFPQRPTS